ncbi:hypothetical protein PR001_g7412 [Phytophthora rubi]|uniref:HTH psq-type domain-containing protein n=1 Tax=Phytophthora rubi TaxID=129364 RepID=A0A6A3N5P3_9STRA|nr:hypothetical protein PR001_g7412 [Phytophthora rubi]
MTKQEAIATAEAIGNCKAASEKLGVPRRTLRDWLDNKENIDEFSRAQTSKTLKGQRAKSIMPFAHDMVTFMKDVRREEEVLWLKRVQPRWLRPYLTNKKSPESELSALMRLLQRLAAR